MSGRSTRAAALAAGLWLPLLLLLSPAPVTAAPAAGTGTGAAAGDIAPVRLNQAGLLARAGKHAILPHPARTPLPWTLHDAAGHVVAAGHSSVTGDDAASGQHLHQVDFSAVVARGDGFVLTVGPLRSRPFSIGDGPYGALKRDALAYFHHNRAGMPIEARFVGAQWARPAGHVGEVVPCFGGRDRNGNDWPACAHRLDVTGGWYDAGDHGKYVVNGGIALWTLLHLHERALARGKPPPFPDGSAAMPEAGNGVPDLLDEARWQMEFMLSMQVPAGTRMALPLGPQKPGERLRFTLVDASGMAHHKVADRRWTALPMPPHLDPEPRFLYPPGTAATLNLAATAAQAARLWRTIDPAFAERCLRAAVRAWEAARRVPDAHALGDFEGSGGYGDDDLSDEFFWAAAELLATTRLPVFAGPVTGSPHFAADAVAEPAWPQVAPLGLLSLSLQEGALPPAQAGQVARAIRNGADRFLHDGAGAGYRQPLAATAYGWGSNAGLLNRAIVLAHAHDATGEARYRDKVVDVMDYLLGRNPLDQSYISGYGARPMRHPHHRFWAPSLDPALPPPPPGVLSGGPNARPGKEALEKLGGPCAPQACWLDDIHLYTLNEVTINWNAPLLWVAAWLDETG
ncbi:glycoside hydrolase family 9 protein [Niveispirillum fermenti]|uniref:glycoside hydrolase family 9 protein n=1 Tax=Niveispirillum fermenti TaxID=1233113 RepID=UPI003A8BC89B